MISPPHRPNRKDASVEGVDNWLITYLPACARNHEPQDPQTPIDELRIFDNSLHRVDEHLRVMAQSFRGWTQGYEDYLSLRMSAFAAILDSGTFDLLELLGLDKATFADDEVTRITDVVAEVEQLFCAQEPAESEALLRRLQQLPRGAVVDEWYRPVPAFERWAEAVLSHARTSEDDQWSSITEGGYARLLRQLGGGGVSEHDRNSAELIQRKLASASRELQVHLRGEAGLSGEAIEALRTLEPGATTPKNSPSRSRTTLLRVSTELADMSDARGGDLLNAFVVKLAEACHCDVCDFVSVEGSELRPIAISDPAAELKELLEKPYRRAEGIAGSAMLLPASSERRWVGTNDLSSDPRQSLYQAQSWTKATNSKIHDYWVFPVYRQDGNCFGAFRVFNRLSSCWQLGTPWSEGMLWELREVAAWFEAVILPRLSESEVVPRTVAATAHSATVQHLKANLGLKWIDEDFLVRLITHATQIAHRKVEALSLGSCIGVFADPPSVLTHNRRYYAAGEVSFDTDDTSKHLEDAAAAYAKINPAAGMFVFDSDGRGQGVINLRQNDSASTEQALLQVSKEHPQSLLLFLDRGQDCIRFIAEEDIVADYYLSEASGEWTLRMYRQLLDLAVKVAPPGLTDDDVREVFRRAVDLSFKRIGAMLILGDGTPENVAYEHETPLENVNLRSLSPSEFADMAAADGAVRIEPGSGDTAVTAIGAIVRTALVPDAQADTRPEGSRHSSAAAFSERAHDHMVFIVSENRALTVMTNGTAIIDRR